jgi:hypothetical protein
MRATDSIIEEGWEVLHKPVVHPSPSKYEQGEEYKVEWGKGK